MGALRAAELSAFGMRGVGAIFEAFHSGELTDDDEVAVAHGDASTGYRAASDAMVDIRATLARAQQAAVLSSSERERLERAAKATFYPDRSYARLIARAESTGELSARAASALRAFVRDQRVAQKREDALLLLRSVAGRSGAAPPVAFTLAVTEVWQGLRDELERERRAASERSAGGASSADAVIDELLLSGRLARVFDGGLMRALGLELAQRSRIAPDARAVEGVADDFRRERGLLREAQFSAWLGEQQLANERVDAFFEREASLLRTRLGFHEDALDQIEDYLRTTGEYGGVAARAESKAEVLASRGLASATLRDTQLDEDELWSWYFTVRLGRCTPEDLESYARSERVDKQRLLSAVVRERCYWQILEERSRAPLEE
jgi:hypothetical protein